MGAYAYVPPPSGCMKEFESMLVALDSLRIVGGGSWLNLASSAALCLNFVVCVCASCATSHLLQCCVLSGRVECRISADTLDCNDSSSLCGRTRADS